MQFSNKGVLIFVLLCVLSLVVADSNDRDVMSKTRTARINWSLLGLSPTCSRGCPQHYCDDDPAIIHGYCCGCAGYFDSLPVRCPPYLNCPANTHSLCQDYEFMMNCCC